MIKELEPEEGGQFLSKYFPAYHLGDVYEKMLGYLDDKLVAIISYSEIYERVEINYIVILPEMRRKGIATRLLTAMLDEVKNRCVSVSLEVNANNKPAINLYKKNGFDIKAIRHKYYGNDDAYLMVKDLR